MGQDRHQLLRPDNRILHVYIEDNPQEIPQVVAHDVSLQDSDICNILMYLYKIVIYVIFTATGYDEVTLSGIVKRLLPVIGINPFACSQ